MLRSIQHTQQHLASTLPLPRDFRRALEAEPAAYCFFYHLPAVCRRRFVAWVEGAHTPDARLQRVNEALNRLANGVKHP